MKLNTLKPAPGAKTVRRRVGRGIGSGLGKTCGRGHKGQHSRNGGGRVRAGFEGGQMPLQRRLPKVGFRSRIGKTRAEVFLYDLNRLDAEVIDLAVLIENKLVPKNTKRVKVVKCGELEKKVVIKGLVPTAGAKAAIEAAGGSIEE